MEDKHCPGIDVKLYSVILEKCLHVLGLPNEYSAIGGGDCGKAFLVNGKVYKITTDKSEAIESTKLIGKRNYFLADIYDVKQINTTLTNTPTFLVVGEKLRTDRDSIFYEMQEELASIISQEIGEHLFDVLYYYRFKQHYYNDVYKPEVELALNAHQREKYYYNSLLSICDELRKNNIQSLDLQYHNLGLKPNGNLAFFDLGFGEEEQGRLNSIDIGEEVAEEIVERVMSYMKGSSAMKVKKKCQIGGNGDGTSTACNQGDISNIELSPIKEESIQEHTSRWKQRYEKKIKQVVDEELDTIKEKPTFEPMTTEAVKIGLNDLPFKTDIEQAGGKIYSVGGAVRDNIIGRESKDLDILITGVPMDTLDNILRKYGRVDNVGKSFGIIKFNSPKTGELDIAIPRTERKNAQGGHRGFDVTSDHTLPVEKDLERRDFTINAIAKDVDGVIIDPHCGQGDIEKKCIRMVNPQAFADDPLRMLRAVQFAARFGFEIEPETLASIQQNVAGIKTEPFERILEEFKKIVDKGNPLTGAKLLRQTGLYSEIFGVNRGINLADFNNVKTLGEFVFGLIKNAVANPAEFFKDKLKGDIDTYREIKALELGQHFNGDLKTIFDIYKNDPNSINTKIFGEKFTNSVNYMKEHNIPFSLKEVPVNGNDLMAMGLQGKQIGDMFVDILSQIYKEELPNEREAILNYVKSKQNVNESIYSVTSDDYKRLTDEDLKRLTLKILNLQIKNPEGQVNYLSDEDLHDFFFAYLATVYNKSRVDALTSQFTNANDIKYNDNKYYIIQKLRDVGLLKE